MKNNNLIPYFEHDDLPNFIAKHKALFHNKFTDNEISNMLTGIWNLANTQWSLGYNQGYYDPEFIKSKDENDTK